MNPSRSNDSTIAANSGHNFASSEEMISAITLDPLLAEEELKFQKQHPSKSNSRSKATTRFDKGSDSKPLVMPRRKLSCDDDENLGDEDELDYKATQHSENCTFFLEEECPYDAHKDDTEPTYSLDSFEIGEPREKEEPNATEDTRINPTDEKSRTRRNYRKRRSDGSSSDGSAYGRGRSAISSLSFDLSDVSEEQDDP